MSDIPLTTFFSKSPSSHVIASMRPGHISLPIKLKEYLIDIIIIIIIIIIYLFTAIGLSPGGGCYFTSKQNTKLVTNKFKSGGLHEKHVVATWNLGNQLSFCL